MVPPYRRHFYGLSLIKITVNVDAAAAQTGIHIAVGEVKELETGAVALRVDGLQRKGYAGKIARQKFIRETDDKGFYFVARPGQGKADA